MYALIYTIIYYKYIYIYVTRNKYIYIIELVGDSAVTLHTALTATTNETVSETGEFQVIFDATSRLLTSELSYHSARLLLHL